MLTAFGDYAIDKPGWRRQPEREPSRFAAARTRTAQWTLGSIFFFAREVDAVGIRGFIKKWFDWV